MVTIRQGTHEDAALITRMVCTVQTIHANAAPYFFKEAVPDDPAIMGHIQECLASEDYVCYIAEMDEGAVGYVLCFIRQAQDNPYASVGKSLVIDQISVEEAYRGTGIADKLMQQALDLAQREHISRVQLGVWDFNERAVAFYKKYGFEVEHLRMAVYL